MPDASDSNIFRHLSESTDPKTYSCWAALYVSENCFIHAANTVNNATSNYRPVWKYR